MTTTKANIQLLGWWLVLFAYVVLVGLWDLVLLNCHRPELPSGEQQSRKGPSDLFISDITSAVSCSIGFTIGFHNHGEGPY